MAFNVHAALTDKKFATKEIEVVAVAAGYACDRCMLCEVPYIVSCANSYLPHGCFNRTPFNEVSYCPHFVCSCCYEALIVHAAAVSYHDLLENASCNFINCPLCFSPMECSFKNLIGGYRVLTRFCIRRQTQGRNMLAKDRLKIARRQPSFANAR